MSYYDKNATAFNYLELGKTSCHDEEKEIAICLVLTLKFKLAHSWTRGISQLKTFTKANFTLNSEVLLTDTYLRKSPLDEWELSLQLVLVILRTYLVYWSCQGWKRKMTKSCFSVRLCRFRSTLPHLTWLSRENLENSQLIHCPIEKYRVMRVFLEERFAACAKMLSSNSLGNVHFYKIPERWELPSHLSVCGPTFIETFSLSHSLTLLLCKRGARESIPWKFQYSQPSS